MRESSAAPKVRKEKGELLEVEIEKLSTGGDGVARESNLVIFVPFSAPGDRLRIQLTEIKKNFARAEIVKILKPSPLRVNPPCEYFGECGGCNWQHLNYDTQLGQKEEIVKEHLNKVLSSEVINSNFQKIISSPSPWNYRTRIQLHAQDQSLGFFSRKSHKLIPVKECLIAHQSLSESISSLQNASKTEKKFKSDRVELSLTFPDHKVRINWDKRVHEPHDFSQVNQPVNEMLVSAVVDIFKSTGENQFLDLYCGSGNFSFPLFHSNSKITGTGVELSAESIKKATQQCVEQNISPKKLRFLAADVENWLRRESLDSSTFVLLDPPRTGLSENVSKWLNEQTPHNLVYVSCNPATLSRDLKILMGESSTAFQIKRIQPFDMFPQTDHVEVLVWLQH